MHINSFVKNIMKIVAKKITLFYRLSVPQGSSLQVWSLPAQDPRRPHSGYNDNLLRRRRLQLHRWYIYTLVLHIPMLDMDIHAQQIAPS